MNYDTVIVTMIVEDGVVENDVNDLANKYKSLIKKEYKGYKLNVQAVQNSENILNISE